MKNLKRCTALFMVAAIFVFGFASCETETDGGNYKKPVATVTAAPEVSAVDIEAGAETALISAGTASGGTLMYAVTTENTKPTSTEGFSATLPTAKERSVGTYYVWYYVKGNASHDDSAISEEAVTVSIGAATFSITVTGGTASLTSSGNAITRAEEGVTVYIKATVPEGKAFDGWEASDGVTLAATDSSETTFTMIAAAVTITAKFKDVYTITVTGGKATSTLEPGVPAITSAEPGDTVYVKFTGANINLFDKWEASEGVTLEDPTSAVTSFTMIASNVTITAKSKTTHTVTVVNGLAFDESETYQVAAGFMVDITANNPPAGKVFDKWVTDSAITIFAPDQTRTGFVMIDADVTVTATYKDAVATIKDHPTTYGDVVFSNGKACSVMEVQYLTAEQIADARGVAFKVEDGKAWILSLEESSTTCAWAKDGTTPAENLVETSLDDGAANMAKFNSTDFPFYDYIAGLAGTYAITGQTTDWYLPAKSELEALGQNSSTVHVALAYLGKTSIMGGKYWSSSEDNASRAWYLNSNTMSYYSKTVYAQCKCRAVKVISTE